ncbi:MAG: phosphoribosylformylglycinamidine synthase [Lachnospiraceae bacterium]|nr:phosphoribosylformylglycinamidine synthase [Lachnospiraceae bacterium]
MVYRIFVEKKPAFANEAASLLQEARELLGIPQLKALRLVNRYDVEGISPELFAQAVRTVFSEPQVDEAAEEADFGEAAVFAVEYLPGQFDQRADSAAQCIQIISQGERPLVHSAKIYALYGDLSEAELATFKKHVINPVEAREASLEKPETLKMQYEIPAPVAVLSGFSRLDAAGLAAFVKQYALAMDERDIACCQAYFQEEGREPTITEIRMLDTYWSDHCRHTTFMTRLTDVKIEDPAIEKTWKQYLALRASLHDKKPVCLMDLATIAVKELKRQGRMDKLDESEEINACTVKITVDNDGQDEPWLLLFKNETHNHPTEIEPFGGAATCIGGAIRDPLSGRAYVYGAMRVTGAADPTVPLSETLPGKLPQRTIVTQAAAGYSSYGNQIGLATGLVDELYHPGYAAKRMEIGAVIAAAPAENVRRERPEPGDVVILLGGATGRDGIGGATGSSKAHDSHSVETCGAEVQKGNAPEERKLQRLFRDPKATRLIKRCNDFGAGGVSVAIGELADGLDIDLNKVPKKYEGLDGTELAISESQERMAVVVAKEDEETFLKLAAAENLSAVRVAVVTESPRLVMHWNGKVIVDISREFLSSNGAQKEAAAYIPAPCHPSEAGEGACPASPLKRGEVPAESGQRGATFTRSLRTLASSLKSCSRRGLSERFDSTIGAATVLMPFGGKHQLTPIQAMVHKLPVPSGHTDTCSLMAYGFDPELSEQNPYRGAYISVAESVAKLIAAGASREETYFSFQEYFEKLGSDPKRWGKPLSALLGAFRAQLDLGIGAIGGKDSMSGSFEKLDVPPTLVSFAVTTDKASHIISPELKKAGSKLALICPAYDKNGLPDPESLKANFDAVTALIRSGAVLSAYVPGAEGAAAALMKMAFGNGLGVKFGSDVCDGQLFTPHYGAILVELDAETSSVSLRLTPSPEGKAYLPSGLTCVFLGEVTDEAVMARGEESVALSELLELYEDRLEKVYKCNKVKGQESPSPFLPSGILACPPPDAGEGCQPQADRVRANGGRPTFLIPVFPGTNCEYDSARAVEEAGGRAQIFVIRNRSAEEIARSVEAFAAELKKTNAVFIPGGFSGGDEPDGSGKFITAFFRNEAIRDGIADLMDRRGGLMLGICNGFQALIKLGLLTTGRITEPDGDAPTLTFNRIGRHQSRLVRTRIASTLSPWLKGRTAGDIVTMPISHGEGRFVASDEVLKQLAENGQIATQYVDLSGSPTQDIRFNPNGSALAIEGITSPDGRIFGKMGHCERVGTNLYKNVPGDYDMKLFESAVKFFRG